MSYYKFLGTGVLLVPLNQKIIIKIKLRNQMLVENPMTTRKLLISTWRKVR